MGTKAAQTQATRRKLERVARELFAERGFAGVSAEELVAQANVTRGALYHHYAGKEGLFEAVVDTIMDEIHRDLVTAAAGASDPLQALRRGVGAFLELCAESSRRRILLVDAPAVLGWTKWREMDSKYGFGLLKQALAEAMRAKLLRRGDVDVLAHLLMGALTEAAMVVARSSTPGATGKTAERALLSMLDAWRPESGEAGKRGR
jgi:AcrR family transcriptional regulator